MTISAEGSAEKTTRDPRHVLVMLGADWSGEELSPSGLSADLLLAELAKHGFEGHRAMTGDGAAALLREWPIGAAILDLGARPSDLFLTYELLHSSGTSLPCLLLGNPSLAASGQQPGALDRLDELVRVDETCSTELILLYLRALLLRAYPSWTFPSWERPSLPEPVDAAALAEHNLICVFSAKGGTGKTTIASNLAYALANDRKKRVALLDGDLYFGDIDIGVGLVAKQDGRRRSLLTAVEALHMPAGPWDRRCDQALEAFDARLLDEILHSHPSGMKVLPAPPRPEMAEGIHPKVFARAVELCWSQFDYTIVDMRSSYSEAEIQLLDTATRIIVVLKPEMSCIRNTTLFLDYAVQFGWKDKLLMVLNRADSNRFTQISQAAVEQHLAAPVIPVVSSGTVPQAASEGKSLFEAYPDSKVTASLNGLVDIVDGQVEQPTRPQRRFPKLLPGRLIPGTRWASRPTRG